MPPILMMAAALAASQATTGQSFEPLTQAGKDAPLCTAEGGLCVSGTREGAFAVTQDGKPVAQWTAKKEQDDDRFLPLPSVLRLRDGSGVLIGVGVRRSQMYSGGNAEVILQRLMLVRWGQNQEREPVTVMEAPYSSDISIRACFDEKDRKQRRDACADQYALTSTLKPAPDTHAKTHGGMPDLMLVVKATNFPRGVSRNADSLAMPALTSADLVEETDTACTYSRRYTFDAVARTYRPDAPLPPCEDFTVP
ncbi:hypothetical protein [Novosphingobium resinovorum]|uniref:hypothetical protein n=1 Tax=Novosphingobium resinovorum TaxID=158500 RepID=UPI002ED1A75F|nr:hypothetical protein [Novosphingobium resinovorum]